MYLPIRYSHQYLENLALYVNETRGSSQKMQTTCFSRL